MMMLSMMQWSSAMSDDDNMDSGFELRSAMGRLSRGYGQDIRQAPLHISTQRQRSTTSATPTPALQLEELTPTEISEYLHGLDPQHGHVSYDDPTSEASQLFEEKQSTQAARYIQIAHQLSEQQRLQRLAQRRTEQAFRELLKTLCQAQQQLNEAFQNTDEGEALSYSALDIDPDCSVAVLRFAWHQLTFMWFPHTKPLLVIPQEDASVSEAGQKQYFSGGTPPMSESHAPFFAGRLMVLRGDYAEMMDQVNGSLDIQDVLPFELGSLYVPSNPETLPCLFRVAYHERPEDTLLPLEEGLEACVFQFIELLSFGGYLHE